jgi:hypothetical protein
MRNEKIGRVSTFYHLAKNLLWNKDIENVKLQYSMCILKTYYYMKQSQGSSVSIVSDYGLNNWGLIPGKDKGFFFQPLRPDWLWDPPRLLSNGYRGSLPWG